MFYCTPCAHEREWPEGRFKSHGKCEVCGKVAACSDIPSRDLPLPKQKNTEKIGRSILKGASEPIDNCAIVCTACKPLKPFECIAFPATCEFCGKETICRVG